MINVTSQTKDVTITHKVTYNVTANGGTSSNSSSYVAVTVPSNLNVFPTVYVVV